MRQYLAKLEPAVLFILEVTSEKNRHVLKGVHNHKDLKELAEKRGYDVTRDTLTEAMKIIIDRKLEREGIPGWVRAQLGTAAL